jgi:hypothetical protein
VDESAEIARLLHKSNSNKTHTASKLYFINDGNPKTSIRKKNANGIAKINNISRSTVLIL